MAYRIKAGYTAFVDGALRKEGYEFARDKEWKTTPEWAEKVVGKPKTVTKKATGPKEVSFKEEDLLTNPTVQL